jgi:vacuolar-type H+-ATPase subunit B/Vma2
MSMMEKAALQVLQNMTGLTPDEMRAMIEGTIIKISGVHDMLKRIEDKLDQVLDNTPKLADAIEHKSNGSDDHAETQ